jgi:hypothetical protein
MAAPRSTSAPKSPPSRARPPANGSVTHHKGEISCRARRLRDRQLRAPDRAHVRHQRAGDSGRAPVHRLRESPELKAYRNGGGRELAVLRESDQSYYLREERMGWILGPYEKGAPARFADGVPDWFGKSLFEGDLDRLAAARRGRAAPRAGARELRHQGHRQRPDFLHARTAARWSDRPGTIATCGSTRDTVSASPPPAAPAGSWPSGSSRASRASTCWRPTRAASARTAPSATW